MLSIHPLANEGRHVEGHTDRRLVLGCPMKPRYQLGAFKGFY
jgi:hypothetical protein